MTFISNLQQAISFHRLLSNWTSSNGYIWLWSLFSATWKSNFQGGKKVFRAILLALSLGKISDASPYSPPNSSTSLPRVNLMFAAPGTVPTSSGMTGTPNSATARSIRRNLNQNFTFGFCSGTPLSVFTFYLILLTFRDDLGVAMFHKHCHFMLKLSIYFVIAYAQQTFNNIFFLFMP